jgi:carbon storage regulator
MLVLGRKIGEKIRISGGVLIQVLSVKRRSVRIGIEAPPEVPIWRAERLTAPAAKQTASSSRG